MNNNWRRALLELNVSKNKLEEVFKFAYELDDWKSTVLSTYCLKECKTSCCDFENLGMGLGWLNEVQLREMCQLKPDQEVSETTLGVPVKHWTAKLNGEWVSVSDNGRGYEFHLKKCPAYKERKCSIHDSPNRPAGCDSFPIDFGSREGLGLYIHKSLCPAMNQLDLSHIIKKCLGFEIPPYYIIFRKEGEKFPSRPIFQRAYR